MNKITNFATLALVAMVWIGISCCDSKEMPHQSSKVITVSSPNNNWNDYWFAGKAEVNSYKLTQSRYGQDREGIAILIFVTEDFSKAKQVKLDYPSSNPTDKVSILKMNMLKKFNTGIYDYSMMASAFTPISTDKYPHTLKVTSSAQEWCGQTWTQYNRVAEGYKLVGNSYFESESDETKILKSEWLEDEIWNRIRINPAQLPLGAMKIIPSSFYSRLNHIPFNVEDAILTKQQTTDGTTFTLKYTSIDRHLKISIEQDAPYKITNWEETTNRGTTKGSLMKSMHIPYWKMNANRFEVYRDSLMID